MPAPKKLSNKPTREVLKRSEALKVKKRLGKFVIFSIAVIILVSALVYVLYIPALSVRAILVQGNDILDSEDITASIEQTIGGKYFFIFPKKSIFIYPKETIITDLKKQFPRLLTVDVGIGEYDSLIVDVKERESDSIWCQDGQSPRDVLGQVIESEVSASATASTTETVSFAQNETTQGCYFSDDTGYIFAPAPYFSNSVFMELSGFLSEQPISTVPLSGSSYEITTHFAKNLAKIFNKTDNDQYRLIRVEIIDKNNYQAILADTSKPGDYQWKIFFDNDESAEELTNNLYTVLNSDPFKKEMTANKGNLASIDLRYGKKVFYKFK